MTKIFVNIFQCIYLTYQPVYCISSRYMNGYCYFSSIHRCFDISRFLYRCLPLNSGVLVFSSWSLFLLPIILSSIIIYESEERRDLKKFSVFSYITLLIISQRPKHCYYIIHIVIIVVFTLFSLSRYILIAKIHSDLDSIIFILWLRLLNPAYIILNLIGDSFIDFLNTFF